ncbi:hypothetical protein [Polaromonas sp.]|uniref:hypothetical protein n=1 Tax=Polaromonas sp. TaxID=1869339 RepID=UPI003529F4DB
MAKSIIAPTYGAETSGVLASSTQITQPAWIAASVRLKTKRGMRFDEQTGLVSDFITAGAFSLDQCPGQGGNPAKSVTYFSGERKRKGARSSGYGPGYIQITLCGKGRARVICGITPEEAERRAIEWQGEHEAQIKQSNQRRQAKYLGSLAARELANLTESHDNYRANVVHSVKSLLEETYGLCSGAPSHGFSYSGHAQEQIREHLAAVLLLVRTAETIFNKSKHEAAVFKLKSICAKGDSKLTDMLQKLTGPTQ